MKLVEESRRVRDERSRLRELVENYCRRVKDQWIRFCMKLPERVLEA